MKITKRQLKRIIREEKAKLLKGHRRLNEGYLQDAEDTADAALHNLLSAYLDQTMETGGPDDLDQSMIMAEQEFMAFCANVLEVFKQGQMEDPYGPGGFQ